jgi:molybdopterin-guanine dinucleotide biosynthesis protein A
MDSATTRSMEGVSALVLAGGLGSRLGGADKASLDIGGLTTLERVRQALDVVASETILVVNDDRFSNVVGVELVHDPEPHAGVLPALLAALELATQPVGLLVACDMPFLNADLLRWLVSEADGYDVVMPIVDGRAQPMHAIYRRDASRDAIARALARGDRRMISFLDDLRVRRAAEDELRRHDPGLLSFFNVNTPEDLAEARRIAGSTPPLSS